MNSTTNLDNHNSNSEANASLGLGDDSVICHYCDTLVLSPPSLQRKEYAICPHCESPLEKYKPRSVEKYLAWILAAFVLLLVSVYLPFISLEVQGIKQVITLPSLFLTLWQTHDYFLAVLIAFVLFAAPVLHLLCMLIVLYSIKFNSKLFITKTWMKVVSVFKTWNMIDVYLMGIMVTFIKLVDMGDVIFGYAFMTYVLWVLIHIYINIIFDNKWVWRELGKQS